MRAARKEVIRLEIHHMRPKWVPPKEELQSAPGGTDTGLEILFLDDLHAEAVQEAISQGRDPTLDPKVQQFAQEIERSQTK